MASKSLLWGVDVVLTYERGKWVAWVGVGSNPVYSSTAKATEPELAIGKAILKQAGMTKRKLEKMVNDEE